MQIEVTEYDAELRQMIRKHFQRRFPKIQIAGNIRLLATPDPRVPGDDSHRFTISTLWAEAAGYVPAMKRRKKKK